MYAKAGASLGSNEEAVSKAVNALAQVLMMCAQRNVSEEDFGSLSSVSFSHHICIALRLSLF
jgi:hypothetical protein